MQVQRWPFPTPVNSKHACTNCVHNSTTAQSSSTTCHCLHIPFWVHTTMACSWLLVLATALPLLAAVSGQVDVNAGGRVVVPGLTGSIQSKTVLVHAQERMQSLF